MVEIGLISQQAALINRGSLWRYAVLSTISGGREVLSEVIKGTILLQAKWSCATSIRSLERRYER